MTRDIQPPPQRPAARPPWELQLGYDLEAVYCAYTEAPLFLSAGFTDDYISQLRTMGGWAAERLRELDIDASSIELLESALEGIPSRDGFPRRPVHHWVEACQSMGRALSDLMDTVGAEIGDGRRYYDYGVMLNRIELCAGILHAAPTRPAAVAEGWPDLVPTYRKELMRVTAVLQHFITDDGPDRPRDPQQRELDRVFDAFAAYLQSWRSGGAEPDEDFFRHLEDVAHSAGFVSAVGRFAQMMRWSREPAEPLPPQDRWPLPTPHTDEDRERLQSLHLGYRTTGLKGDPEQHLHTMRQLLHLCRHVLGPVHPVTLNVQIDFANAHALTGRVLAATVLLSDIARTAMHYYGPLQETRYLIVGHVCSCLQVLNPELARSLYEDPLRSLLERDEEDLPPSLHNVRRTIRRALGMDAEPSSGGNDDAT
ncbi:hypothetical protein [Actinomadura keratinilytica]|uniref:Uncharacterized protein n=2 Tax=Actinomadura keratinilytica TaxID=547461 RepID=A0ABP7ZFS8_9ACTN